MAKFEMYPTIITPYTEKGQIDFESLDKLIGVFSDIGCEGIFAVCQSSEMFFLSEKEKLLLAEKSIEFCRKRNMKCVVSGHTQDSLSDQIKYLMALEALSPDAVILVNNRFAAQDEPEEKAIEALQKILNALSPDTCLGVYECPHPYKRPLSESMLKVMAEDGRFRFVKDTSCQIGVIGERLQILNGSGIGLYNANAATLLESMDLGCAGFSGVMLNLIPEIFGVLHKAYETDNRARIERCMEQLSASSVIESQNYPANAKYIQLKRGIFKTTLTRNGRPPLNESQIKETEAFMRMSMRAYYSFLPHAPFELLSGYDRVFPECHASTVLPLENGNVLCAYFAGEREGTADVAIWLSKLEGGAWKKPVQIAKVNDTAHWNPVLFETKDGVRLIFRVGKTIPAWETYTMLSKDGGSTWSKPERIDDQGAPVGPVRNKPLVLKNGVMLAPNSDESKDAWLSRIDASFDGGNTFVKYADIPLNRSDENAENYLTGLGAIQPALWEGDDGSVHALLRTTAGYIFRSDSPDGGKTWCEAYPTPLFSNNSAIDLVKAEGCVYLVMNPVGRNWGARTPLMLLKSTDDGETFRDECVLNDDIFDEVHAGNAQMCYPAIVYAKGKLHITYTHNRKAIAHTVLDV